ncbi:hypothetical protein [Mycobacterium sp. AZCC_0083]|uniref:hypothetical protein n=1 Tax=Mycobacterium sp. AZCC_0083 TaxID=2735882 RepID=UPI0017C3F482|nr:hypothetical protein [Mycobacterium sp. AZCC_0083]MBB5160384.1 hypothetical protein [Mycobacterium sp. AZCC_0083]
MVDELLAREHALRRLPLAYSLALRLRDAGVALEMVAEYLGVEDVALEGIFRIAEAKLLAAQERVRGECEESPDGGSAVESGALVTEREGLRSPASRSNRA